MAIVVLGGTGHIGSYLIPRLVELGHEVVSVSRGQRTPYPAAGASACWDRVRKIELDRESDEERFAAEVVALRPRAIVDMICFTLTSCQRLIDALLSASPPLPLQSFIHIGSIWAYGPSIAVPTLEAGPHAEPLAEYGAQKRAIASYLLTELTAPWSTCVLHPGHIVGRGWAPLNPQGNFDPSVFATLRRGGPLLLPNLGSESVHHVHADDIASAVIAALERPERAAREAFSVVSKQALTLRGYATAIGPATWPSDPPPPPTLNYAPCGSDRLISALGPRNAEFTHEHVAHSPCCSAAKLERALGVVPTWTSIDAIADSLRWIFEEPGRLESLDFNGRDEAAGPRAGEVPMGGAGRATDEAAGLLADLAFGAV